MEPQKWALLHAFMALCLCVSLLFLFPDDYMNLNSIININNTARIYIGLISLVIFLVLIVVLPEAIYPSTSVDITKENLDNLSLVLSRDYSLVGKENKQGYSIEKYTCPKKRKPYICVVRINSNMLNLRKVYGELLNDFKEYISNHKTELDLTIVFIKNNYLKNEFIDIYANVLEYKLGDSGPINAVVPMFVSIEELNITILGLKYDRPGVNVWYTKKIIKDTNYLFDVSKKSIIIGNDSKKDEH